MRPDKFKQMTERQAFKVRANETTVMNSPKCPRCTRKIEIGQTVRLFTFDAVFHEMCFLQEEMKRKDGKPNKLDKFITYADRVITKREISSRKNDEK